MKKNIIFTIFFALLLFTPILSNAAICANSQASAELCNPIKGVNSLPQFGFLVAQGFGVIIGWQVIAMVMFAGFRMIMAQGNAEEVTKAKSALQWSLSGFVLAMFSFVIVYAISKYLKVKETFPQGPTAPENLNPLDQTPTFGVLFQRMIQGLLVVSGALAVLMIIISGFRYITARGDSEQAEQAKQGLLWSVIGLMIIALAYVIVVATGKLFGPPVTQ